MDIFPEIQELIDEVEGEFPSASAYAKLYRHFGMQVVPAYAHSEPRKPGTTWKRPKLATWKQYQKDLMSDAEFNQLYGPGGEFVGRDNMGMFTQVEPRRIIILDLDTYKTPQCIDWWHGIHAEHNMGIITETVCQQSGGGGEQHFFICPEGWSCPTNKNATLGIDSRGLGGFTMLPPSLHESGKHYQWKEGYAPWEIEFTVMPKWMCDEVEAILGVGASQSGTGDRVRTSTPQHQIDEWGKVADGREDKMTRMVFRAVLELYRDCPIIPTEDEQSKVKKEIFERYVDATSSRIREPGTPKHVLLEREGRGITLFNQKWRATIRQWDDKISTEASRAWEPPKREEPASDDKDAPSDPSGAFNGEKIKVESPEFSADIYTLLRTTAIMNMPDPDYLIDNIIPAESFGFVIGVPGCLKSFITLDMSLSIAAGMKEWMGHKIKKHGPVVYVTSEGLGDIKKRIKAWEKKTKKKVDDLPFYLIPDSMNMMQNNDVLKLARTVAQVEKAEGAPPALVVIDTASRVLPGADENLQKDMTLFVKACDSIREGFHCAVLAVHHLSRNGNDTMRGSTVFDGASDFILLIKRDPGDMFGTITAKKIKAANDGWSMDFTVKEVEVIPGIDPKTSLYIERQKEKSSFDPGFGNAQETSSCQVGPVRMTIEERDNLLTAIKQDWDDYKPWSMGIKTKNQTRYALRRIRQVLQNRMADTVAKAVIDSLINEGVISENERRAKDHLIGLELVNDIRRNG